MIEPQEKTYEEIQAGLVDNKVVKRPIPRLDKDIVPRKKLVTKPKKYTPMRFRNAVNKYFEWCEDKDEVPSIKGLMIHMKMYRSQFSMYATYPEFMDIVEHVRMVIGNWAENDVYKTGGMAAGKIAYMKNVHGWSDKMESTSTVTKIDMTPEVARAKIEMLAPKLLEILKNTTVLNQLTTREEVVPAEIVEEKSARRI